MNEQEIDKNLLFLFVRGSQAYGTNNDASDEDLGGVCMPSTKVILGHEVFEQKDDYVENGVKTDKVVYGLQKAFELLIQNNPNMLDFLYAPDRCVKLMTPEWERIMQVRDEFLCMKAKWAYQGYAVAQLNRIDTHRKYLLNPMSEPTRKGFGLPKESIFPETQIEIIAQLSSEYVEGGANRDAFYGEITQLFDREGVLIFKKYINPDMYPFAIKDFKKRQKAFLRMISSVSGTFLKDEYADMAHRELKFLAANQQWIAYKRWSEERNEKRKVLEAKCGYDAKHAMHLIRLLRMSVEIMEGRGVLVDRTNIDRDELMNIRNGNVKFDDILQQAKELNEKADQLYKLNPLKQEPNHEIIDTLKLDLLMNAIRQRGFAY